MTDFLILLAGLVILYLGAEGLVRGSVALALRARISPLVVGLVLVSIGTSSPELVVSLKAALSGNGAIAVGNVVGSNICNIALILGLAALIRPVKVEAQLIRFDVPIVIAISLLLSFLLSDGALTRPESVLLAVGLGSYLIASFRLGRQESQHVQTEVKEALPSRSSMPGFDVAMVIVGVAALVGGANLFVNGAVAIAERLGISDAVIGLTVVAVGTSLPELATSVLAAIKKEGDIAIGNVVGSNIFNILGILGVTGLVQPLSSGGIGLVDLSVMTGVALLLLPIMRTGYRVGRIEGAVLLLCYTGYLAFLIRG